MTKALITGKARVAGVIGWPIHHSLSPLLHRHWLDEYGIDGAYVPLAVAPENLQAAIEGLRALNFVGANVTIPHKTAVMPFLDDLSDKAKQIDAVNLIVNRDGKLWGDNTDGDGFITDVLSTGITPKHVLLIGAGGSAKGVLHALLSHCDLQHLSIANRTVPNAQALAKWAEGLFHMKQEVEVLELTQIADVFSDFDLIINTTSLGLSGAGDMSWPPDNWDFSRLKPDTLVYDLVYNPLETPLLRCAREAGILRRNGLGMLIEQARPAFAAWFGVVPQTSPDLVYDLEKVLLSP